MNIFQNRTASLNDPARDIFPVTPSDSTNFDTTAVALYVELGGTLSFVTVTGQTRMVSVPDATLLPVGSMRVNATGTTASGIHGLSAS